jgi:hypothetical protein
MLLRLDPALRPVSWDEVQSGLESGNSEDRGVPERYGGERALGRLDAEPQRTPIGWLVLTQSAVWTTAVGAAFDPRKKRKCDILPRNRLSMRSLEKCYQMAQFFRTQKVSLRRRPGTSTGVEMSSEISGRRPASAGFGSKRPPNRLMDRFPGRKSEPYSPGFSQLSDCCLQFAANWASFGERSSPARTAIRARVWEVSNLLARCGVPSQTPGSPFSVCRPFWRL